MAESVRITVPASDAVRELPCLRVSAVPCAGRAVAPSDTTRENSVKIWGLRGPLGAFIATWGGFCMLTSAPFDNWWHESYGLDVKILSPPHVVLVLGIFVMGAGGLILTTSRMNQSLGESRDKFR